jgi:beta-ribofuranosylaminobenzene 5'-phosphate synthase
VSRKVFVDTGSRLHLGLIDLTGDLGRIDGGIGIYVSQPRILLGARPAQRVSTNRYNDLAEYAVEKLNFHYKENLGLELDFAEAYDQHVGLGSTTQILLAISAAYNALYGKEASPREMAEVLSRGGTSGIGVAGFEKGGFIFDGGHTFGPGKDKSTFLPSRVSQCPPAPALFQHPLPADWRIDIIVPRSSSGLSGTPEVDFFQDNCPIPAVETASICRVIVSVILPAVKEADIKSFNQGINTLTTLGFKKREIDNQTSQVNQIINDIRSITAMNAGISLSSFGPTVCVITKAMNIHRWGQRLLGYLEKLCESNTYDHYVTESRNVGGQVRIEH